MLILLIKIAAAKANYNLGLLNKNISVAIQLVHQKFCKKNEMITNVVTGEIACGSCGSVSSDIAAEL